MAYCNHQQENGLSWGGYVNEYNSFDMLPYDIYSSVKQTLKGEPVNPRTVSMHKTPLRKEARAQIKGIQGQVWGETIRSFEQVEYYLFPKMFGLIERDGTYNLPGRSKRENKHTKPLSRNITHRLFTTNYLV